ncbi:MAG: PDZ domain-containing protein, partial [Silvanigrellaceae bacterium]|nr:PDZ domain-containing protein [Silvanigrellaceae bacterium]
MKLNKRHFYSWILAVAFLVVLLQLFLWPKLTTTFALPISKAEPLKLELKTDSFYKGYLSCSSLQSRISDFLKSHYVYNNFDEEISQRTFHMYFRFLDPGKLYFTEKDIEAFKKHEKNLGREIGKQNCNFIVDVYSLYKTRVQNATELIYKRLKIPFNFKIDEFIETDRKKVSWAVQESELTERWRKLLKFIILNMKDSDNDKKIIERLNKRYQLILKNVLERKSDEVFSIFLNAFALSLDPHSGYLTPPDQAQFEIDFSLKLSGIGASLTNIDGYTIVNELIPGGAASKDGRLKKGDKIIAVDPGDGSGNQDVVDMDLSKVVQLIRGKENTPVKLSILRKEADGQKRIQIELIRAVVQNKDSEAKSDILEVSGKRIGVISLPSFYIDYQGCQLNSKTCRSSSNDMTREILSLSAKKVDGIIVDLRKNIGGDLYECAKIVGQFIDNPLVVQTVERLNRVRVLEEKAKAIYHGPLEILISKYTASASEILAGAVQDYGRGIVAGSTRSFGKATVQSVITIPGTFGRANDGALRVT